MGKDEGIIQWVGVLVRRTQDMPGALADIDGEVSGLVRQGIPYMLMPPRNGPSQTAYVIRQPGMHDHRDIGDGMVIGIHDTPRDDLRGILIGPAAVLGGVAPSVLNRAVLVGRE